MFIWLIRLYIIILAMRTEPYWEPWRTEQVQRRQLIATCWVKQLTNKWINIMWAKRRGSNFAVPIYEININNCSDISGWKTDAFLLQCFYDVWCNHPMLLQLGFKCLQVNMAVCFGYQKPSRRMAHHPFVSHFLKFWVKIFLSYKYKHKKIDYKCCVNPKDESQDFIEIALL